jgi:uncharacterized protein (TIGR02391 family)
MMPSRSRPQEPRTANLTPTQMKAAMLPLKRRIAELDVFDPRSVHDQSDPQIATLEAAIDETLTDIFGQDTVEYSRYITARALDTAGFNMNGTPVYETIQGLQHGKERSLALLRQIIKSFEEKLADAGETDSGRALRAYDGIDLHPEIERRAGKLFRDGHYANAVEDACKALNALVKLRSGKDDLDGSALMQQVFSPKAPLIAFNDLKDDSDRSEQQGLMQLFAGAILAFRNPRAHGFVQDHPERALEYIQVVSLLAKLLDDAK